VTAIRLQPADHAGVRRNNLSLVLRLLHEGPGQSRASVAAETGLNKATVSSLVAELIDRGLVRELGTVDRRRLGRPATVLELDGRGVASLGIELNVDFVTALATDLGGRTLFQRTRAIDAASRPPKRSLATLVSVAKEAHKEVTSRCTTIVGVTLAIPGLVDASGRTVTIAPNLHWHDINVGDRLAEALGGELAVTVDNDANLGALAEYRVGEFAGTPNLVYIAGQTGVGGGLIVGGRLVRGAAGFAGEVGHMHVVDNGSECGCGRRGCWETLVGLRQLLRDAVPDLAAELESHRDKGPEAKVGPVIERATAKDPVALEGLRQNARWLGIGLATLVNIFNPQVVVLGGFFRDIGPWVLPLAEQTMREYAIAPDAGGCRVVCSSLGFSAAALGGAIFAAERVFDDPTFVPAAGG
jgi:predicted NBD/HSP70 family sugar kinase